MPGRFPKIPDYHMHTPLCQHAEGAPVEYARKARDLGLLEIGFSDHSPMPEDDFDDWRMKIGEFPRYLEWIEEAREAVPDLEIKLALEVDFLEGRESWTEELSKMADFDYLIGSVHYIAPGWDVDNPKWIGRWKDAASVEEIWQTYWDVYTRCVASGSFDILGHPDLPKKFGFRPEGDLRKYYEPAIAAAVDADVCFEINTAGLRRDAAEMYPAPAFVRMASEAGVPLTINSDAHHPDEVGANFSEAVQLARECGYDKLAVFTKRERSFIDLPSS